MVKYAVGVCTGNSGRSPVFQLVGNNYLEDIGKSDELMIASAGTLVDTINSRQYSMDSIKRFVEKARKRGDIYTPSQEARLDEAVAEGDLGAARDLYKHLIETFHLEEVANRTAAIRHFGIKNDNRLQITSRQYDSRELYRDVTAVITMDERNKGVVRTNVHQTGVPEPYIEVLNQVPGNKGKPLNADAFGGTRQEYFTVFEQVLQQTPVAIDYILHEILRQ